MISPRTPKPTPAKSTDAPSVAESARRCGQVVLVLQGGGALGAYQVGVFQGLHEAGIEPDWIIGTSIGAINGAIIAGNKPADRLDRLTRFWDRVALRQEFPWTGPADAAFRFFDVICRGVPSFFQPDPLIAMFGVKADVGVARAAFYNVNPLMQTLTEMIDFGVLKEKHPRLTVGAVNVRSGEMRYFDSRDMDLTLDHVMASGALPPAFPAVTIDGESYWDGGIYSNTPLEAVFDDRPRRDSLIFAVNLWQPHGETPRSVWDVLGRQKDIQYSSRLKSHIERQDQIHRLRHIIRELGTRLSDDARADPIIREMVGYGCSTTMHLVGLLAPRLEGEDHTKDVDFSADGIRARRTKGHEDILRALERRPWECQVGPLQGVVVHEDGAHNFVVNHD